MMDLTLSIIFLLSRALSIESCDSVQQVEMKESASPGHFVADIGVHISYPGANINSFYLSEDTDSFHLLNGKIYLRKSLDREDYCSKSKRHQTDINNQCCRGDCCIFIGVSSSDNRKKKFYVRVKVLDINDNSPLFSDQVYYKEILENSKINSRISLPVANDADDHPFGVETYEIEKPNENFETYFKLIIEDFSNSKQSVMVIKHQIDRETIDHIEFTLVAIDGGKPPKKGKTKIIIKILDENDCEPMFSQSIYEIKVKENEISGMDLLHVKVEDKDSGNNGKLSINFPPSTNQDIQNTFQIAQTSHGMALKLISKLDYEKTRRYSFYLVAKDSGQPPRSSTASVEVHVINVNDSPPNIEFYQLNKPISKQFARIHIDEGTTKDVVLCLIKVSDEDNPADSISCDIETPSDSFYLTPFKTNIVLENRKTYELKSRIDFDRESKIIHFISVVCTDSDSHNSLRQTNKLEVIVRDVNDNSPVFTSTNYYGFIKENRVNEIVSIQKESILATDKDEGENGTVEYSITDVSDDMKNHFIIDKNTAIIKVVLGLDFEMIKKVTITITGRDLGVPRRSSVTKLTINVKDTNDNQPEVETTFYTFEVYENEPIGTLVGKINVTDKDTDADNKKIIMKIRNSSPPFSLEQTVDQIFSIDNDNGKIYTKVMLDREKYNQITFSIIASNPNPLDMGNERIEYIRSYRESVEIPISVIILDKNDNSPIMVLKDKQNVRAVNPEVSFYISSVADNGYHENCVSFPYVFIDPDDGDNTKVRVTMKGNNHFTLNVDHGMMCINDKMPPKGLYRTTIIAEDGEFNNSRKQEFLINIFIKDDPTVSNSKYRLPNGNSDPRINSDLLTRHNDRYFRNNIIYIIIGSIAAILFLMLIIILIKFRKYLIGERNFVNTSGKNMPDNLECQDFFEGIPDAKYNDLSFVKNPLDGFRSDYHFKSIESKINEKYESTDAMLHDMRNFNNSSKQTTPSCNYQTIPTQFLPETLHMYHSLGTTKPEIAFQPQNNFINYNNTEASSRNNSPIFVNSQSTSTMLNAIKTKNTSIKCPVQSTFV